MDFDDILNTRSVRVAYQPLVDLATRAVVGYEALARGPEGSPWERPDALFAAARAAGRLAELDWVCRAAACRGALEADLPPSLTLFVNVEPESMGTTCPADLQGGLELAESRLRVVCEVTERSVAGDPAGLLAAVARIRRSGWGIALDDVGAEPASLALMPFVHPDVIKLDMSLVRQPTTAEHSRVAAAAMAQAERSGAAILAEGIETEADVVKAQSLGATLGQGWHFGRPGALPRVFAVGHAQGSVPILTAPPLAAGRTPYDYAGATTGVATKALLLPLSRHLESRGLEAGEPPVVLAAFQHRRHFTPATAARYAELAGNSALVAAVAAELPADPVGRVRGADLDATDRLSLEWDVIVIGPHYAGALLARDLGDTDCPDAERRFSFVVTHDRERVTAAARALLGRVVPLPAETPAAVPPRPRTRSRRAARELTSSGSLA